MTIAYTGNTGTVDTSGFDVGVVFGSNISVNTHLVVMSRKGALETTSSIDDTAGNIWIVDKTTDQSTDLHRLQVASANNLSGSGVDTVNLHWTGSSGSVRAILAEFSRSNPLSIDGTPSGAEGNSNTPSGGNVTVNDNSLVLGAQSTANVVSYTAGSGFTTINAVGGNKAYLEYQIKSGAGTLSADSTISTADFWAAITIAYKESTAILRSLPRMPQLKVIG